MASKEIAGKNPHRQGGKTRLERISQSEYLMDMGKALVKRIDERLEILGISGEDASKQAGLHRDTIRDLRRGKRKSLTYPNLVSLAEALKTTSSWLLGVEENEPRGDDGDFGIPFGGVVEAGAFRPQNLMIQEQERLLVPLAHDKRYPHDKQFCFKVIGDSMDQAKIFEGMYVVAIDVATWERLYGEPRDGKLVVVSRQKTGDPNRELTVKRLRIFRDRMELRPESSNKNHEPFIFPLPIVPDESQQIEIIAVVVNSTWLYE